MEPSSLQRAQYYAQLAETFNTRGDFLKASEYHRQASEYYIAAALITTDPDALRSLRLLHNTHRKKASELELRSKQTPSPIPSFSLQEGNLHDSFRSIDLEPPSELSKNNNVSFQEKAEGPSHPFKLKDPPLSITTQNQPPEEEDEDYVSSFAITSSYCKHPTSSSQHPQIHPQDPFQTFWEAVENLVYKLPNPGSLLPNGMRQHFSGTPKNLPPFSPHQTQTHTYSPVNRNIPTAIPNPLPASSPSKGMDASFFMIPASVENKSAPSKAPESSIPLQGNWTAPPQNVDLATENLQLKEEIRVLKEQLNHPQFLENQKSSEIQEENELLKKSITQFKKDYQTQVQKLKQSASSSSFLSSSGVVGAIGGSGISSLLIDSRFDFSQIESLLEPDDDDDVDFTISSEESHQHCRNVKAALDSKITRLLKEIMLMSREIHRLNDRWEKLKSKAKQRQKKLPPTDTSTRIDAEEISPTDSSPLNPSIPVPSSSPIPIPSSSTSTTPSLLSHWNSIRPPLPSSHQQPISYASPPLPSTQSSSDHFLPTQNHPLAFYDCHPVEEESQAPLPKESSASPSTSTNPSSTTNSCMFFSAYDVTQSQLKKHPSSH